VILRISGRVSGPRLSGFAGERQRLASQSSAMIGSQPTMARRHQPGEATPPTLYTAIDYPAAGCTTFTTAPAPVSKPSAESTSPRSGGFPDALNQFVGDSALEGAGFELTVPRRDREQNLTLSSLRGSAGGRRATT
jgi:hypothetical protein